MWAFIIPILVQFLVAFLTELLKSQANARLPDFVNARKAYLGKLKWRIWYGPNRTKYGAALFDRMQSQFAISMSDGTMDVEATVTFATAGLADLTPTDLEKRV